MMLARALLKRYGIVFPMKGRSTEEQKKVNEAEDGSRWLSYDLSADVTSKWASNMSRSEGSTFWVKMVRKPVLEEIALKHATEIFSEADNVGMEYSEALSIMTRALETVKKEQEVTDAAAPLVEQYLATQEDPIAPDLPNPCSITGPENVDSTLPVTDETNEMSGKVDGMAGDADTEMVGANDDEALVPVEADAFDNAFPNNGHLVSFKNLFCMK